MTQSENNIDCEIKSKKYFGIHLITHKEFSAISLTT